MSSIITATHLGAVNGQGSVGPVQVGNSSWVNVCVLCGGGRSRTWFLAEGNTVTQKVLKYLGGSATFSSQ